MDLPKATSQKFPSNPAGQVQLKPSTKLKTQVAPFKHGLATRHGSGAKDKTVVSTFAKRDSFMQPYTTTML